jgi:hypothetical protein
VADMGKLAKDTGYVLLGFGIMRWQKTAVRVRELQTGLGDVLAPVRETLPPPLRDLLPKSS